MDISSVAGRMVSLFIIMVVGYIANKRKMLDDHANSYMTKIVLNISLPSQIVTVFLGNRGILSMGELALTFGVSLAAFPLCAAVGYVFLAAVRAPKEQRPVYLFMSMFANVGFMGYPVILAVFGEQAMIYAVIFNVVFNMVVYSLGVLLMGSGSGKAKFDPKLLLNTPLIVSVVSLILYFTKIPLPEVLNTSLEYMGNLTTPLAMLVLGSSLARMPVRELVDDWRIYIFTVLRLAVLPLVMFAVMRLLPMGSALMKGTMVVMAAMPVATNATMLAIEYDGDVRLISKGIFFSTVLSVATIPLISVLCASI